MRTKDFLTLILALIFPVLMEASELHVRPLRGGVQVDMGESFASEQLEASTDLSNFQPVFTTGPVYFLQPNLPSLFFRTHAFEETSLNYFRRTGITNSMEQARIDEWVQGLEQLGLFSHAVYLASFRAGQSSTLPLVLPALKGPDAILNKAAEKAEAGLIFDGDLFGTIQNPLRTNALKELSIVTVFTSEASVSKAIVGSDVGPAGIGPALYATGSPYQGIDLKCLYFDYSHDGKSQPANVSQGGRRTYNVSVTGWPEFVMASFSSNLTTLQVDIDRVFQSNYQQQSTIWNDNTEWRIGARLNGTFPFEGMITFMAIFDLQLTTDQYTQIRHLYKATLGSGINFPPATVVIEGDSLSAEGFRREYGLNMYEQPNWNGKFQLRNIAFPGEGTAQILKEFPAEALPLAEEAAPRYLFLWAGRNDLGTYSATRIETNLITYWKLAREAGFKVAAFTLTPTKNDSNDPFILAERAVVNTFIRDSHEFYDFLIDVANIPELQDPANLVYFQPDGVHITAAASEKIAGLINAIIPNP
jgi:hypothetical protein